MLQVLNTVSAIISQNGWLFRLLRLGFIGLIACGWPYYVEFMAKRQHWSGMHKKRWQAKRWRLVGWLILMDMLTSEF